MRRSERGANLVEMAIVLPLLVLLFMGVVDVGRAFYAYTTIANASREAARFGSRFPALTDRIKETAKLEARDLKPPLRDDQILIDFPEEPQSGRRVVVHVNYSMPTIIGGILGLGTIPMTTKTEMIIYGPDPQKP